MRITDKAVEAFIEAYKLECDHRYDTDAIRTALTAALPHMGGVSEEMLIAAFLRGESWRKRNDVDRYVAVPEMVEKAARDYADATLSALASHEPTLTACQQEVERLRGERDRQYDENVSLITRNAELVKALEFYRDKAFTFETNPKYGGLEWKPTEELLDDCGNTARAALSTKGGKQ